MLKWEVNRNYGEYQGLSPVTDFPVYSVYPDGDGWSWRANWRYKDSKGGFATCEEAQASAEEAYEALRERTATGGRNKFYHI